MRLFLGVANLQLNLGKKGYAMMTRGLLIVATLFMTVMSGHVFSQEKEEPKKTTSGEERIFTPPGYCAIALSGVSGGNYLYFCRTRIDTGGGNCTTGATSYRWAASQVALPETCPTCSATFLTETLGTRSHEVKLAIDEDLKSRFQPRHPRRGGDSVRPRDVIKPNLTERVYVSHQGINRYFLMTRFTLKLSSNANYPQGYSDDAEHKNQQLGLESEEPETTIDGLDKLVIVGNIDAEGRAIVKWRNVDTTVFFAAD